MTYILGKNILEDSISIRLCLRSGDIKDSYYEKSFSIKNMAKRYVYFAIHTSENKARLTEKELENLKNDF